MVNYMYKVYNGTAPCYLTEMFTKVQDQHQYVTRNSQYNFVIPRVNGMSMDSFAYQGSKVWNSLPNEIKASPNKHRFKTAVKEIFFRMYFMQPNSMCVWGGGGTGVPRYPLFDFLGGVISDT